MNATDAGDGYSIGAVARMTNLSVHTLRAWERRYGAVDVARTSSGQRRYSARALRRLMLIKRLVDHGESISQVAELDDDSLTNRFESIAASTEQGHATIGAVRRVAVLGESLPERLLEALGGTRVVLTESDSRRWLAGLRHAAADAVVIETDFLNDDTFSLIAAVRRFNSSIRVLVVFGFGRQNDVQRLTDSGASILRAPVALGSIAAMLGAVRSDGNNAEQADASPPSRIEVTVSDTPAPRRFTGAQLARLAAVSTSVECECPTHLVDLVRGLVAFEAYSADCENRNDEDSALHAYLHRTTAAARSLIEQALDEVARVEKIAVDGV